MRKISQDVAYNPSLFANARKLLNAEKHSASLITYNCENIVT